MGLAKEATVLESCTTLLPREAEELRVDSSQLLRNNCPPPSQSHTGEHRAIKELKEDHLQVVLLVDKGVAMVVMDKEDCNNKVQELLASQPTEVYPGTQPTK